eukprot:g17838.t1
MLLAKYGSFFAAWKHALDREHNGYVWRSFAENPVIRQLWTAVLWILRTIGEDFIDFGRSLAEDAFPRHVCLHLPYALVLADRERS